MKRYFALFALVSFVSFSLFSSVKESVGIQSLFNSYKETIPVEEKADKETTAISLDDVVKGYSDTISTEDVVVDNKEKATPSTGKMSAEVKEDGASSVYHLDYDGYSADIEFYNDHVDIKTSYALEEEYIEILEYLFSYIQNMQDILSYIG